MRNVKRPFETLVDDGMYNRVDLYRKVADLPQEVRDHPQVHGCWGFIDDNDPRHHAIVIEGGRVIGVLDRGEYQLMRPQVASLFEQKLNEAKSAAVAKAAPKVEPKAAEIVAGDAPMGGLEGYRAKKRAEKAAQATLEA